MQFKKSLFGTTVLAGVFVFSGAAFAQQTAPQDVVEVEQIVVTGSRIARPNLEQPAPVSTITQESIVNSGTTNLGDILAEMPGMGRGNTVRANADSGGSTVGLNQANLRSLGANRTLTLVNGKRHVGGSAGSTAVDLNAVPTALVKGVEIMTGGASAIYGSDAVSGVVNILLRDDFEGMEFGTTYGISEEGLNERWSIDATIGGNFAEGRGNAAFSFFADGTKQVMATEVPELALRSGTIVNPADPNAVNGNGIPNRLWANYLGSEMIDERGVLYNAYTGESWGFTADGTLIAQPARTGDNSFAFGSFGQYCDSCFFGEDWQVIIPKSERVGFNTVAHFDLMPNIRAYVDAKYIRSKFDDNFQPSFRFFEDDDIVAPDNAFLTQPMRDALGGALAGQGVYANRFLGDTGGRRSRVTRATARVVGGIEGDFDAGFALIDWDVSYNYGRTDNDFRSFGTLIPGNYLAATDAVRDAQGNIVCRSTLDPSTKPEGTVGGTCVPYNPFIAQNSPEAIDYITHNSRSAHKLTQQVLSGVFTFDTERFFNFPGGPIGFAGGFEHRKESSGAYNDEFEKTGLSESAAQPDSVGGFDVTEWFAEVSLPLLADKPFAHRLSVDAAYRFADYSHAGEAEAWKVGMLYAPVPSVTFRGTVGEAVRAPNITEAFLPLTETFSNIYDPCDQTRINNNPNRAANCALDTQIPQLPWASNTNASIDKLVGGNPNLDPEKSKSWTAGVILQPSFVPGLALTVDYFSIEIEDAIAQVGDQTIINNCYDAPGGLDEQYCSFFDRETDPNKSLFGNIVLIRNQYVNTSKLETSGWDIVATYRTNLEDYADRFEFLGKARGQLGFSMKATHLEKFNVYQFQDNPDVINNNRGEIGNPVWRFTTGLNYTRGPWSIGWETRFEDRVATFETTEALSGAQEESSNVPYIGSQTYHDFILRVRPEGGVFYAKNTELYIGVNNAFDKRLPYTTGFGNAQYELFGRQFFGGMRLTF